MMKYEQTNTLFALKFKDGSIHEVYSFNAEEEKFWFKGEYINDVSWSHGGTHLKYEDGTYAGHCGTEYFQKRAKEVI